jgi:ribosome-binding factor A
VADVRRTVRVAAAIREEVALFLADRARDPRILGMVTVTGVDVTRDLRHAKVHVSILGADEDRDATLEGLESLAWHLRSHLGKTLRLRVAPEVTFKLDESIARAARIHQLLHGIERERRQDDQGPSDAEPGTGDDSR